MNHDEIIEHYSELARSALAGAPTITDCAPDAFDAGDFGAAGYSVLDQLPPGAVGASLGCGNPLAVAALRPGETVLDLGSGGGIDVLLSAERVGPEGHVYGLDASADMIRLGRQHAEQAGVTNVEFLHGRIETIPLSEQAVDVVISNCVINLSSDRRAVIFEMFRVLRPAGRIGISDVVSDGSIPPEDRAATEHRVGCHAGCPTISEYRDLLEAAGFSAITITTTADHGDGVHSAIVQATKP
ncbi:MAG: methyltransferase domain-containing protein [Nocardioidaceae bacterium]